MQEPTNIQENILSSELDNGGAYLRRLYSISKYLLVVAILISLLGVIMFLPSIKLIKTLWSKEQSPQIPIHVIASMVYTVVFVVLFPIQVFYFFRFSQTGKNNYLESDRTRFSQSLRFLVANAWMCCVTYTLNLVYFLFLIYTEP